VSIYIVRHAKAGSRHDWGGDDTERPLTKAGRRQADALAERLGGGHVAGLWSSPYVRCVQTLEPLGRAHDLEVQRELRLAEGARLDQILALFAELPDGAVACSHGDVIPGLLDALVRRGTEVVTKPDWRKGAIWVLDPPDGDGIVATAAAEPPPA
jgi:phosphohistidine phosphatase SixA